jgi:hypothetical protein
MEVIPMNIEDSLRAALRPQDPGAQFTARVIAAVSAAPRRRARLQLPMALAASMVATAVGLGLIHQQAEQRRVETARQQLVLALEITSAKLNQVQQRLARSGNEENGT